MAGLFWNIQAAKKRAREREDLANALRSTYEQPEAGFDPGTEEYDPGTAFPEMAGMGAKQGGVNIQNALNMMYQGRGDMPVRALELQQALQAQQIKGKQAAKRPRDIEVYEYWLNLGKTKGPTAQKDFENIIRQNTELKTIGGVPSLVDRRTGNVVNLSSLLQEAGAKGTLSAAGAAGAVEGKSGAEARIELPTAELQAEKTTSLIDDLLKHPGLESAFGVSSYIPAVRGTDRADFEAILEQLQDSVFISNRQALKGGGAITDFEGKKAENAELRAKNAQSAEAFRKSMSDYKYWVDRGLKKLRKRAGVNVSPGETEQKYKVGQITTGPDGRRYVIRSLKPDGTPDDVEPAQ